MEKKLYRSKTDYKLMGVCGGLGQYLGLDSTVIRVVWIIASLLGGLGLLFYVYAIVLSVLTLKTEKKAQQRAYSILKNNHMATAEELEDLKELFRLYNIQYINDIILSSLDCSIIIHYKLKFVKC